MKRLYRIREKAILGGVCAGLGEYFNVDPTLVRILCIVSFFLGLPLIVYLIAWLIIPPRDFVQ